MIHELKTDPKVFQKSWVGVKPFEVRRNDRNFRVGDRYVLIETIHSSAEMRAGKPLGFTGRRISGSIGFILEGYGLCDGVVAFAACHDLWEGQGSEDKNGR